MNRNKIIDMGSHSRSTFSLDRDQMSLLREFIKKIISESLHDNVSSPILTAVSDPERVKTLSSEKKLFHRSPDAGLSQSGLSSQSPRQSKQSKRGGYVGFYMYESTAQGERFGHNIYSITLPAGTVYLDISEDGINTSRISTEVASRLRDLGIRVIKGRDVVGPAEWVVISDDLLSQIEKTN